MLQRAAAWEGRELGLRFGTAAETTRGLGAENFKEIANLINKLIHGLISGDSSNVEKAGYGYVFSHYDSSYPP
ncbi:Serine hydroxymethyltransferase [Dirofilaria immitis]